MGNDDYPYYLITNKNTLDVYSTLLGQGESSRYSLKQAQLAQQWQVTASTEPTGFSWYVEPQQGPLPFDAKDPIVETEE